MIVNSQALVLSAGYSVNANNPVFGWRNIVTADNLAASETAEEFYPVSNLANPSTAERWISANTDEQYLTVTTGTSDEIDYVGIAGHNFGTAGIIVSVEGQEEDGGAWVEIVEEYLPSDDTPLILRFDPQSLFAVRVKMQPDAVEPYAAVLYAGKLLVSQRRTYVGHTPITMGRNVDVATGVSEGGAFLGSLVLSESRSTNLDLKNLTPAWYREEFDPFVAASIGSRPFFFGWRPGSYPQESGFAWFPQGNLPRPVNARSNGMMDVSMSLAGIAA